MKWNSENIGNLDGKTVVITGANSGLGFSATEKLAEKGAEVVMACRSPGKGREAKKSIEKNLENPDLQVMKLDLADLSSVRKFAESFRENYRSLDVLCNNAGLMAIPRRETEDGFEMQLGVNHLGHFALTAHLIDMIEDSTGRVINQSSKAHEGAEIDFEDLMGEENYSKWEAYGQSKLANLLFTYELDRRLEEKDIDVKSVACHPGVSDTNLFKDGPQMEGSRLKLFFGGIFSRVIGQSSDKGCLPMLYAATSNKVEGGDYIGPGGFRQMRGNPEKQESSEVSYNMEKARKLWEKSEELTGISFQV